MRCDLQQLTQAIEAIERRGFNGTNSKRAALLSTNWSDVDQTLGGGLQRGAVHEWFHSIEFDAQGLQSLGARRASWFPPLAIFIHLAWRSLDQSRDDDDSRSVIWIGRRCWPHLRAMVRTWGGHTCTGRDARATEGGATWAATETDCAFGFDRTLLKRSLFIDPPDDAARLWAIDLALRSIAGGVVIADGSHLDMPATRRLQLAAEAGDSMALIARPPHELSELSAATTRWVVRPTIFYHRDTEARRRTDVLESDSLRLCGEVLPRWTIQLLRCKGLRPSRGTHASGFRSTTAPTHNIWAVEWNSAQGCVNQLADVVDRPDSTPVASTDSGFDQLIHRSSGRSAAARRSA